eukprot:668366-Prorocentrum_minimum.AAC.1
MSRAVLRSRLHLRGPERPRWDACLPNSCGRANFSRSKHGARNRLGPPDAGARAACAGFRPSPTKHAQKPLLSPPPVHRTPPVVTFSPEVELWAGTVTYGHDVASMLRSHLWSSGPSGPPRSISPAVCSSGTANS